MSNCERNNLNTCIVYMSDHIHHDNMIVSLNEVPSSTDLIDKTNKKHFSLIYPDDEEVICLTD